MEAGRSLLSIPSPTRTEFRNHVPIPVPMVQELSNRVVMRKFHKSAFSKKENGMLTAPGKKKTKNRKTCAEAKKEHQFDAHLEEFESQFVIVRSKRLKERRLKNRKITNIPKYVKSNKVDFNISSGLNEKIDKGLNKRDPLRFFFPWGLEYNKFLTRNEEIEHIIKIKDLINLEEAEKKFISHYNRKPSKAEWAHVVKMNRKDLEPCIINGKLSLEKMIRTNFRYVVHVAKQYDGNGVFIADLVQEGNMALMKSLKKFEINKGYRFKTYAHWWVHHYMKKSICESRMIQIPMRLFDLLRKIKRERISCIEEGIVPTNDEIAKRIGMTSDMLRQVLCVTREPICCDYYLSAPDDKFYEELVRTLRGEYIKECLKLLKPRERTIIEHRFGLIDEESKTLEEIGDILDISRERVRQIESCAMDKLRKIVSREDLARYVSIGCKYRFSPAAYDWEKIVFWDDYISKIMVAS